MAALRRCRRQLRGDQRVRRAWSTRSSRRTSARRCACARRRTARGRRERRLGADRRRHRADGAGEHRRAFISGSAVEGVHALHLERDVTGTSPSSSSSGPLWPAAASPTAPTARRSRGQPPPATRSPPATSGVGSASRSPRRTRPARRPPRRTDGRRGEQSTTSGAPRNVVEPSISGTFVAGRILTASIGTRAGQRPPIRTSGCAAARTAGFPTGRTAPPCRAPRARATRSRWTTWARGSASGSRRRTASANRLRPQCVSPGDGDVHDDARGPGAAQQRAAGDPRQRRTSARRSLERGSLDGHDTAPLLVPVAALRRGRRPVDRPLHGDLRRHGDAVCAGRGRPRRAPRRRSPLVTRSARRLRPRTRRHRFRLPDRHRLRLRRRPGRSRPVRSGCRTATSRSR